MPKPPVDLIEKHYSTRSRPVFNKAQQLELLRQYRATNDPEEKARLHDQLISSLWRYARSMAEPYIAILGRDVARQAAYRGLSEALEKMDLSMNTAITTYATYRIRLELMNTIYETRYCVRISRSLYFKVRQLMKQAALVHRVLTLEEIAEGVFGPNYTSNQLRRITTLKQIHISAEDENSSDDYALFNPIARDDSNIEQVELQNDIRMALKHAGLSQRSRIILIKRFGLFGHEPMELEPLGRDFHVTGERIRQIVENAIKDLKEKGSLDAYKP